MQVQRTMWNIDKTFIIMKYEPTYHGTTADVKKLPMTT